MLCLLLLLPILSQACTTRPRVPPPNYWTTSCDIPNNFGPPAATFQCTNPPDPTKSCVGVEVDLFIKQQGSIVGENCVCGGRIFTPGIQVTPVGAYVTWSCETKPEIHAGIYDNNGVAFKMETDSAQTTTDAQGILSGPGNYFGFGNSAAFLFDAQPNPPNDPCSPEVGGWKRKLWVCFRDIPAQIPARRRALLSLNNFQLELVAGSSSDPNHQLQPISPSNTVVGVVNGDVHFMTLDAVRYTFNAAGDYIYAKTKTPKFDLHVRQTMTKSGSVLAALGLRDYIKNDVIELWWDGEGSEKLHVDGRKYKSDEKNQGLLMNEDYSSTQEYGDFIISKNPTREYVEVKHKNWGEEFSLLALYNGKASFRLNLPKEWETEGLAGNKNGVKEDDLCFRDPRDGCLNLSAKSSELHEFGLSWKVNPHELLFEQWMSVKHDELVFKKLKFSPEQLIEASRFCFGDRSCVYDYISTGDKEFARHTLEESISHSHKNITYVGDDFQM